MLGTQKWKSKIWWLFLPSKYTKTDNKTSWLAVTQFETTGARKSFPCFDEPDRKAKFLVKLGRKSDMTAVSNMPKISEEKLGNDMVLDTFENSVKMSTYLLAFLVSDFTFTRMLLITIKTFSIL